MLTSSPAALIHQSSSRCLSGTLPPLPAHSVTSLAEASLAESTISEVASLMMVIPTALTKATRALVRPMAATLVVVELATTAVKTGTSFALSDFQHVIVPY